MLKVLFVSSTSACVELESDTAYYAKDKFSVLLNGEKYLESDTNVFSLFNLCPNTRYTVEIAEKNCKVEFVTAKESCCIDVRSFGAKGDGVTDDTLSIQNAINCLPKNGRLYFGSGTYCIAPITLKNNITIELDKGATLLGSTDERRYPVLPGEIVDMHGNKLQFGTWEGNPSSMPQALIFGAHVSNVNIIGQGVIDGNAQNGNWWKDVKTRRIPRPRLVFLNNCNHVYIHGVTGQNSASWQFHPYFSRHVGFYQINVNAPKDSPNTDGLDPESCDYVDIVGCSFSVGDDCIALKSGKIYMGSTYKAPANHHTIRNCLMQFGHGAITLGSEMAGGVKNLTVSHCVFNATDRGLRIKSRRGRGKNAVIDGVTFEHIEMCDVLTPIVINSWYNCCDPDRFSEYVWSRECLPVDEKTPRLGKFVFRNMNCVNCHVAAAYCDGLPELPIEEITLDNVHFTYNPNACAAKPAMCSFMEDMCKAGAYFDNVLKLTIKNVTFDGVEGEQVIIKNVGEFVKE